MSNNPDLPRCSFCNDHHFSKNIKGIIVCAWCHEPLKEIKDDKNTKEVL